MTTGTQISSFCATTQQLASSNQQQPAPTAIINMILYELETIWMRNKRHGRNWQRKPWYQEMMWKQHYRQCKNGTLKAIIETTKIEFNLPDMQVTELSIHVRVKWMRRKENKKHSAVHETAIATLEKAKKNQRNPRL